MEDAGTGDMIKVDAKSYDQVPWGVMEALVQNSVVSLVITWNGGKTITIPAGRDEKALKSSLCGNWEPFSASARHLPPSYILIAAPAFLAALNVAVSR